MLTVKLIEPNGHEQIHEALSVWTREPTGKEVCAPGQHLVSFLDANTGLPVHFGVYGAVFVMNREGKTVASYRLPDPQKK